MTDRNLFDTLDKTPENKRLLALEKSRSHSVAIANNVIDNMRMGMSAKQQDVLDYMLSLIRKGDTADTVYTFLVKDYCDTMNIDYRRNSKNDNDMKAAIKSLKGCCKWIEVNQEGDSDLISWFRNEKFIRKTNSIQFQIDESIAPYLFNLAEEGNFSKYELRQIGALKSKYSKTLYRILIRYANAGNLTPILSLDRLKEQLAAENYTNFKDFRKCVLSIAEKEINEMTFLKMEWDYHKAVGSRSITHITFKLDKLNAKDKGEGTKRFWNLVKKYGEYDLYIDESYIPIHK